MKLPNEYNCIRGERTSTYRRKALISENFDSRTILKKCKENRCSFNDAVQSIMGQTINDYARRRKENIKQIVIASTFAIKNFAKDA